MSSSCGAPLNPRDFLTKKDKQHDKYCTSKNSKPMPQSNCNAAEGCAWDSVSEKCTLNTHTDLASSYLNGGIGFGKLCLDRQVTRLMIMFVYPPLYIFLEEKERTDKPFANMRAIILCFIYTCMFYFPGLIYALKYKHTRGAVGSLFGVGMTGDQYLEKKRLKDQKKIDKSTFRSERKAFQGKS
jgi:hypothetical protein